MNKLGFGEAEAYLASLNPNAIRGKEQIKIVESGGAQSKQGTSSNKNNGIRDNNPKRDFYFEEARREFGSK